MYYTNNYARSQMHSSIIWDSMYACMLVTCVHIPEATVYMYLASYILTRKMFYCESMASVMNWKTCIYLNPIQLS